MVSIIWGHGMGGGPKKKTAVTAVTTVTAVTAVTTRLRPPPMLCASTSNPRIRRDHRNRPSQWVRRTKTVTAHDRRYAREAERASKIPHMFSPPKTRWTGWFEAGMLERHKLLMGRTQDRAGQNNGSIGVFWRSFNGIIGHIRYMFRGLKITHNHEHSSL